MIWWEDQINVIGPERPLTVDERIRLSQLVRRWKTLAAHHDRAIGLCLFPSGLEPTRIRERFDNGMRALIADVEKERLRFHWTREVLKIAPPVQEDVEDLEEMEESA